VRARVRARLHLRVRVCACVRARVRVHLCLLGGGGHGWVSGRARNWDRMLGISSRCLQAQKYGVQMEEVSGPIGPAQQGCGSRTLQVQDVLWWTLYQAEGLLKGSWLRKKALEEAMRHIHYEVGGQTDRQTGGQSRPGLASACLKVVESTVYPEPGPSGSQGLPGCRRVRTCLCSRWHSPAGPRCWHAGREHAVHLHRAGEQGHQHAGLLV
jgi:hypothetical protein